jgi:hypothetical protein
MNCPDPKTETRPQRDRAAEINRIRRRLSRIKPEDQDMIEFIGAVKGMLDIIADDGVKR